MPVLTQALSTVTADKKLLEKIADGLSVMDKNAEIQCDRKGNIIYDKETKDTELVKWEESIEDYMAREVLPLFLKKTSERKSLSSRQAQRFHSHGISISISSLQPARNWKRNSQSWSFLYLSV